MQIAIHLTLLDEVPVLPPPLPLPPTRLVAEEMALRVARAKAAVLVAVGTRCLTWQPSCGVPCAREAVLGGTPAGQVPLQCRS